MLFGVFVPERLWPSHAWYTFIFSTGFLSIFLARIYWHARKMASIWLFLALLLIIHIFGYSLLLRHTQALPGILYLFTIPIEIMVFAAIIKKCLNVMPGKIKL